MYSCWMVVVLTVALLLQASKLHANHQVRAARQAAAATLPADPKTDAPNLTWLHLFSAGSNHIQSHPIYTSTDITITTSSGVHGPTIAEWAVLTRLVESRKYNHLLAQQRAHAWNTHDPALRNVRDQAGGTLGVLGYGSIGRQGE